MSQQYAKDQPHGYSNYISKVAIVGVTGSVGKYITKSLLATGKHSVTALTRKGGNTSAPQGVKLAPVDYSDNSTIVEALKGHDILIITLAVTVPENTHQQLSKAARDAGVPWIVTNNFGLGTSSKAAFDVFLGQGKLAEQQYIESLSTADKPISWIAVACGFWYEFSLAGSPDRYGFEVRNGKREVVLMDNGKARMSTSSWARVGEAVAALLSLRVLPEDSSDASTTLSKWRNDTIEVSSFVVSQQEMWESLQRVTGTSEGDWTVKHETAKERFEAGQAAMKQGDRSGFSRQMYSRMFYHPEEPMVWRHAANVVLGLEDEDVDTVTKNALKLESEGVFATSY